MATYCVLRPPWRRFHQPQGKSRRRPGLDVLGTVTLTVLAMPIGFPASS